MAGATGLVAQALLRQMRADEWQDVRALTRRTFPAQPPVTPVVVDYDQTNLQLPFFGATHLFSCLGTTMKQAGSQEAFRRVDLEIPLMLARAAREAGVPHYLLVSSVGANATSRTFYLRVKAELEDTVSAMGFRSVTIVRPSFLEGDRKERRLGEILAVPFMKLAPARFKSVHVDQVARAMLAAAQAGRPGVEYIENPALRRF